jgi:hypothetical protein
MRKKRGGGLKAWPTATLVCLILLALLTVVQVVHVHQVDTDADHCPLCIAMHTAVPVVAAAAVVVLAHLNTAAPTYEACAVTRYWHPQLFTRPPPDGLRG